MLSHGEPIISIFFLLDLLLAISFSDALGTPKTLETSRALKALKAFRTHSTLETLNAFETPEAPNAFETAQNRQHRHSIASTLTVQRDLQSRHLAIARRLPAVEASRRPKPLLPC